jgi:hypothetical protein
MGSGETAPTMVKVHRAVLDRLGAPPVPAVLLDTPFGFQENATELALRIVNYFSESLRTSIEVAGAPAGDLEGIARSVIDGEDGDPFAAERLVARLRDARYVFAGPGSPTYALRQWKGTVVPSLLSERLERSGALTFSSAAALTIGLRTVPVYEIYKAGEDPYWLEGLDLLSPIGLPVAVIPHYNNAEGGTHDTRFCYLGERRLSLLERELPDGSFVLGIDEHTALTLDLDSGVGTVAGIGVVTVRARGRSRTWASGETVTLDELLEAAADLAAGRVGGTGGSGAGGSGAGGSGGEASGSGPGGSGGEARATGEQDGPAATQVGTSAGADGPERGSPLLGVVREREEGFAEALGRRHVPDAVRTILALESDLRDWSRDIPAGDEMDRAHASLRTLIVELGQAAEGGVRDPREAVGPFVEAMLELRRKARSEKRFEDSDWIRDQLAALGVEVRDVPGGSEWLLGGGKTA